MILVEPLVYRPILQYAISMSKFRIRREKTEKLIRVEKYQRKAAAVGVQGIIYQVNILYQGGNLPGQSNYQTPINRVNTGNNAALHRHKAYISI